MKAIKVWSSATSQQRCYKSSTKYRKAIQLELVVRKLRQKSQ